MPKEITQKEFEALVETTALKMFQKEIDKLAKTPAPHSDKNILGPGAGGDEKGEDYRNKLYAPIAADGFSDFQDYLKTLAFFPGDSRLVRIKMEEGDPEAGGYLCPVVYHDQIFSIAIEKSVLLDKIQTAKMTQAEEKYPRVIDTDHSAGATFGGIKFLWIDEKGTKQESEPKLGEITLKSRTACSLCKVTNSLLEDSKPSVEKTLKILFADALSWTLDDVILRGSGAGCPKGILNSAALVTIAKEGGQAADTILFKNIKKMFAAMHPALRDEAIWLISPSAIEQVLDMSMVVGAGGGPLLIPYGGGGIAPIPDKILGRPLIFTEHCSALGDLGDIFFVHPKSYLLGIRKEMTIDASVHVYFQTNCTLFRIEFRGDGQPIQNEKLTIRSGGGFEVSPFVTLAAR
jgi:HK97 family phage major capsid protein